MTSKRLKRLAKIRLILSVLAILLAALMIVSGVMHFRSVKAAPPADDVPAATAEAAVPEAEETEAGTDPTDAVIDEEGRIPVRTPKISRSRGPRPTGGIGHAVPDRISGGRTDEAEDTAWTDPAMQFPEEPAGEREDAVETDPDVPAPEAYTDAAEETAQTDARIDKTENTTEPDAVVPVPDEYNDATVATDETTACTVAEAEISDPDTAPEEGGISLWGIAFWLSAALLAADLLAIIVVSLQIEKENQRLRRSSARSKTVPAPVRKAVITPQVSTIHQMGRREYQQDSLGHASILNGQGYLAVVADGMGGLTGGDKVSQQIVMDMLTLGHQLTPGRINGALWKLLDIVNENANRALGPEGLYKSGSTVVAVLICDRKFQWISVGDSRIYLYRQGYASQLNQDHDQLQAWMPDILSGRRSMEETLNNPDSRKLTSFIGMGQLKHIDGSYGAIPLEPGDRLVLMSDGVYNMITENQLADILKRYPDVRQAATAMDGIIRDINHPCQDNYTAIVLGF